MANLDKRFPVKPLAYGGGGLVAGLLLAYAGALVGASGTVVAEVAAGTIVVVGITLAFLAVFLFLLPPLIPSR